MKSVVETVKKGEEYCAYIQAFAHLRKERGQSPDQIKNSLLLDGFNKSTIGRQVDEYFAGKPRPKKFDFMVAMLRAKGE